MGYRLESKPTHLFDVFFQLKRNQGQDIGEVVKFYPDTYSDDDLFSSVAKFAFPCPQQTLATPLQNSINNLSSFPHETPKHSKKFTFVLTNIESKFRFGFCYSFYADDDDAENGVKNLENCYCFISYLPYFSLFYEALEVIRRILCEPQKALLFLFNLHGTSQFDQSQAISFQVVDKNYCFIPPCYETLQKIPDNVNLTIMQHTFVSNNLVTLFASLLFERRVLLHSKNIEILSACVHGVLLLLYPMKWQHLFIPVLPPILIDYCSAPMPFIIGMHTSTMKTLSPSDYGDAVVIDLDEQTITSEHVDLNSLPKDVTSSLKKNLKRAYLKPQDDAVTRVFLTAMVKLIGCYRNALRFRMGESITFDPDSFVRKEAVCDSQTGPSYSLAAQHKMFCSTAIHLQCFQQFIQERLDMLNSGGGFQDQFENECSKMGEDRWRTQSRYKDWMVHWKNKGKVLKKESKDKWSVFAKKVKKKSKNTWKEVKSKIEEIKKDEDSHTTFHISSKLEPPPRPPPPKLNNLTSSLTSTQRVQHYHLLDTKRLSTLQPNEFQEDDEEEIDSVDDDTFVHKMANFNFDPTFKTFFENNDSSDKNKNQSSFTKHSGVNKNNSFSILKKTYNQEDEDDDFEDDEDDVDLDITTEKMRKSFSIEGLINNDDKTDLKVFDKDTVEDEEDDVNLDNNDLIVMENSMSTSLTPSDFINKKTKVKSQSSLNLNHWSPVPQETVLKPKNSQTNLDPLFNQPNSFYKPNAAQPSEPTVIESLQKTSQPVGSSSGENLIHLESIESIEFDPLKLSPTTPSETTTSTIPTSNNTTNLSFIATNIISVTTTSSPIALPRTNRLTNISPNKTLASLPDNPVDFSKNSSSNFLPYYHKKKDFPLSSTNNSASATKVDNDDTYISSIKISKDSTFLKNEEIPVSNVITTSKNHTVRMRPKPSSTNAPTKSKLNLKSSPVSVVTTRPAAITTSIERKMAFIQSDCNLQLPPANFDHFDPIASGQLVLDTPVTSSSKQFKSDDQLLKEWNLYDIMLTNTSNNTLQTDSNSSTQKHNQSLNQTNQSLPNLFKPSFPQQPNAMHLHEALIPQPVNSQSKRISKEDLMSLYSKPPFSSYNHQSSYEKNIISMNERYNNTNTENLYNFSNNFQNRTSSLPQKSTLFGQISKQPSSNLHNIKSIDLLNKNNFNENILEKSENPPTKWEKFE